MKSAFRIHFEATKSHPWRMIRAFGKESLLNIFDSGAYWLESDQPEPIGDVFAEAQRRGFKCSFDVVTQYEYDDALVGELGVFDGGFSRDPFSATLPRDAFDFSGGCPRCGMGAAQVKPHVLSERSLRCRHNFYVENGRVFVRAEIGREIIEATKQPWCMRHPVTRAGKSVEEFMEAVPCATMPPLSRKSEGILFGSSAHGTLAGEPPEVVPPCPVCGRVSWGISHTEPTRLVYPRAAIDAAKRHAVLVMYEPWECFPSLDPIRRTYRDLYGLPWLLFNRQAIEVLMRHSQREHFEHSTWVQPVFSE